MFDPGEMVWHQPDKASGSRIGHELEDPDGWWCDVVFHDCRDADAAIVAAEQDIHLGAIARPYYATVILDDENPFFRITDRKQNNMTGERLDKVGMSTGWTSGNVIETCVDISYDDYGTFQVQCADRVDYQSAGGDSGSPVFFLKSDSTVQLRGIHFGRADGPGGNQYAVMSDLRQIELDLGSLIVVERPVSVGIVGPRQPHADVTVTWGGDVDPGRPPYSYEWRRDGVLVSTDDSYTGNTGDSSFELAVEIVDARR